MTINAIHILYLLLNNHIFSTIYKEKSWLFSRSCPKNYFNIDVKQEKIEEIKINIILFAKTNKMNNALLGLKQIFDLFKDQIIEEQDILKNINAYLIEAPDIFIQSKNCHWPIPG